MFYLNNLFEFELNFMHEYIDNTLKKPINLLPIFGAIFLQYILQLLCCFNSSLDPNTIASETQNLSCP